MARHKPSAAQKSARPARGEKPARDAKAAAPSAKPSKNKAPKPPREAATPPAKAAPPIEGFVAVAEIARPHGVLGELRLKLYNPDSDLLARRPRVKLRLPSGEARDGAITAAREANKALLVRIAGVDDRDAAEALRGTEILVPRDAFPPLAEGEFYACDLEGARALMRSGEELGRVTGVASYPTCDVLLIDREGKKRIEVPLLDAYVGAVDAKGGTVEIVTIEGLD